MNERASILIVEDEPNLGHTLREYMDLKGHRVDWASNRREAWKSFRQNTPSVVLMDVQLPDGNGLELARDFRAHRQDFALLFLSAQNDPPTRLKGLQLGAEDYITKPFELQELTLRLQRILVFRKDLLPPTIAHGPLQIHLSRYQLIGAQGQRIPLSQRECAILRYLYSHREEAVQRDEIIDRIWGEDEYPSPRTVDNYIVKLRKWCETDREKNISIQSIRGVGYRLTVRGSC